ncbi:MAG: tRNA 5-methoxyuridine(34)/uridine 5-oxyacetic acid(34) synthase CmoB [Proteobacteria bacterium]|nr:tRNA 5-methoxyuridine(34)/uridine 5-oxyacetic acid(34) synthase CmoB [Desulfobulbaceae bacterium]MBU4153010.1 tRNA 5-methoxyuridine(34)/uridine 5-oxyacetic acid(34) synthase CmoB [Pseudomonadota bacterium]
MVQDYLSFMPTADHAAVKKLRAKLNERFWQDKKGFLRFRQPFDSVSNITAQSVDFLHDVVCIGAEGDLGHEDLRRVDAAMRAFMPWRKGPFEVFGITIDAEWRSDRKWGRVLSALPDLDGKVVADIGCNNGYYMFRMAAKRPAVVLGFEPSVQHYFAFKTLNSLADQKNLYIEPFGVENIGLFPACFDLVFLMGIIYHRISPVEMLKEIKQSIKPGGTLIVESQAIPGELPVALFPEKTYAKVPGTYFVPTSSCLVNWLLRAGFVDVEVFAEHPMGPEEQRRTDWMTFESFSDFVDPENSHLTIEGYPAPWRVYVKARG